MKLFRRTIISLKRNYANALTLTFVFFLMSLLIAGSLLVRDAVYNTDVALRMRLPAIVTIRLDENQLSQMIGFESEEFELPSLTPPVIREIGNLEYVRTFNYSLVAPHFFSDVYNRVFKPELFFEYFYGQEIAEPIDWLSTRSNYLSSEIFEVTGVQYANVLSIESGLNELSLGRTFTEEEIDLGMAVAMVSQDFLDENHLQIGDTLVLDYRVFLMTEDRVNPQIPYAIENIAGSRIFELEIIGSFSHERQWQHGILEIDEHFRRLNTIYAPNRLVEQVIEVYVEAFQYTQPYLIQHWFDSDSIYDVITFSNALFLLYDPLLLHNFNLAVQDILPEYWVVDDLSGAHQNFSTAMESLGNVTDILIILTGATMIIACALLMAMAVQNRRHEIGIYLALGEHRINILKQLSIEFIAIVLVGTTAALFLGNIVADSFARMMLSNELSALVSQENLVSISSNTLEGMGFRHEVTQEEFMEIFELNLDLSTAAVFYIIIFIVIAITTAFVYLYIKKISPLELLQKR